MSIINILSCLAQCALHFACKLLKCFRAYTICNDCFFSSCFSTLKRFPIGFKSGLAKLLQSIRQQVAKIVETLHLLGAYLISPLSLTLQPPSPLISVDSKTKICWELKQSTLKGGGGRGSGKGFNSRCGGHWKLEKVFFNESASTILQLVVWVGCDCIGVRSLCLLEREGVYRLRLIWCFQKKGFNFLICCEWKMASDKLDFGGVSVWRNLKAFQCFLWVKSKIHIIWYTKRCDFLPFAF